MKANVKKLLGQIIACVVIASIGLISVSAENPTTPSEPVTNEVIDLTDKTENLPSEEESRTELPENTDENQTDLPEGTRYYEYYGYTLENGEATIVFANPHNYNVTIPSEVDGYPVVAIAENAYDGVSLYDLISIPSSVRRIDARAFAGARINGYLIIYQELEEIGEEAFKGADIEKIYFAGTEKQFSKINIADGNENLLEAELNDKFDLSGFLFKASISGGINNIKNSAQYLLIGAAAPLLMIVPPLGISALFAPVAGATDFIEGMSYSWSLFIASIAALFV